MKKFSKVRSVALIAAFLALTIFPAGKTYATDTGITTSSGSTAYASASAVVVDSGLTITGDTMTGAKVMIENFKSGDVLSYSSGSLPSGVSGSWNSTTGVLSFTGSATAAQWQDLLRTVTFNTTSTVTDTRSISFSLGSAIPLNGHFYEYVSASVSWTTAKANAAARTYFGMQGYLATITSAEENQFIFQKLQADAWIGASDSYTYTSASEGYWYWVTGPEAGTLFSVGNNSPVSYLGRYMNWNGGEPNNSGSNEHYGEIYSTSSVGKWNDLPNTSLLGYVVEYGGMAGDSVVQVSAQKSIAITNYSITYNLDGGTNYAGAPSSYTPLTSTITLGTPTKTGCNFAGWFDAASGGNQVTQIVKGSSGDKVLYARWTPKQYTVTFKNYDNSTLKAETVNYNESATPPTDPERTGYTFAGWSGTYTNVTATQVVTATYTPNTNTAYKIKHYKQDVTGSGYTLSDTDNLTGTTAATATAAAKTYTGFSENTTYESRVATGTIAADGSLVLSLYYDRDECTITFKDYDNTILKTETVRYQGTATPPTDPERTGYTFDSWIGTYANVTSSQIVRAFYWINTYTISYDSKGGSSVSDADVVYGLKATKPTDPTKTGNKLAGWYKDDLYSSIWDFSTDVMPASDVTLYAKWIPTPSAPELLAKTATTIELKHIPKADLEYRVNGGSWQDSELFENLTPDTEYTFEVRLKASGLDPASYSSESIIKTNKVYIAATNDGNSITGVGDTSFDPETEVVIEKVTQLAVTEGSAAYKVNFVLADEDKAIAGLYDIKLLMDGQAIQPNGTIRIRIKLTAELLAVSDKLEIFYINDNGEYEVIPHHIDGDSIVFEVNHLSQYAVIAPQSAIPVTGEDNSSTFYFIGIGLILTAITILWFYRKRNEKKA